MSNNPKTTEVDWSKATDSKNKSNSQTSSSSPTMIVSLNESTLTRGINIANSSSKRLIGNETFNKKGYNKKP